MPDNPRQVLETSTRRDGADVSAGRASLDTLTRRRFGRPLALPELLIDARAAAETAVRMRADAPLTPSERAPTVAARAALLSQIRDHALKAAVGIDGRGGGAQMLRADAHDAVVAAMHNLDYFEARLRDAGEPLEELRWGSDTWTRGGHVAAFERQQWREVRATWTAAITIAVGLADQVRAGAVRVRRRGPAAESSIATTSRSSAARGRARIRGGARAAAVTV